MTYKTVVFLVMWVALPGMMSAQKYLSTDSKEILKEWKGHQFSSHKTLQDNLKDSPEMSFMNAVFNQKSVQNIFQEAEMLTVFVLMDSSFSEMDKEEIEVLLQDSNRIQSVIKSLSVPGRIDKNSMVQAVKKHGVANLSTLSHENLQIIKEGNDLFLIDSHGKKAKIEYFDFYHQKGLFHLIKGTVFMEEK